MIPAGLRPPVAGAVAALVVLAGCGGPSGEEARGRVAQACEEASAALARVDPSPPPAALPAEGLAVLSALNAADAALDAAGSDGADGERVGRLREAVLDVRGGFSAILVAARDGSALPPAATARTREAYGRIDAAAGELGLPSCGPGGFGRALFEDHRAVVDARARDRAPTGDYARDAARGCGGLVEALRVAPAPASGPAAQARALRGAVAAARHRRALDALSPPAELAPAHAALLADLAAVDGLVRAYVDAVGVADVAGSAAAAGELRLLSARIARRHAELGIRCR